MKRARIARGRSGGGAADARPEDMQLPVDITFRDMTPSNALEATIERWADRLARIEPRIQRCRVVIERPHRNRWTARLFHVRVELTIPGDTLVVGRDPARDDAHADPYVAVADAFRALRGQLLDTNELRRAPVELRA